ncbi:MAG: 50S ribosomal protein L10 [Melioribacteraceae bacterium]|nr:50S ribosomal protein L10 [Melioribacteraceae bacterium]MCF8264252.1 50S ribosomal protein L10 [Melioribacteraceae bacterium]MCF8414509.1 50S ribosomal protein L10 [Melioribacteraceae bacterium]MCF8432383.1 50S ribosomal protein L10 [Melioribacteraceae bacterium]
MNKQEKAEQIAEIKEMLANSNGVYLVDYSGVSVEQISNLRREFSKEGVTYKVYKNTLFKKAVADGGFEEFNDVLVGMTGFAFSGDNFVAPAKIIKKFNDDKGKFNFKGCYLDSQFYGADQLKVLASMPTKEEVMAGIVGSIAAPASGIVGAINAVMRDIVSLVDEISKKKAA